MINISQYRSMPINGDQCRSMLDQRLLDRHWTSFIDRHWCQCQKFDPALIGIDRHWSLKQHVLKYISVFSWIPLESRLFLNFNPESCPVCTWIHDLYQGWHVGWILINTDIISDTLTSATIRCPTFPITFYQVIFPSRQSASSTIIIQHLKKMQGWINIIDRPINSLLFSCIIWSRLINIDQGWSM